MNDERSLWRVVSCTDQATKLPAACTRVWPMLKLLHPLHSTAGRTCGPCVSHTTLSVLLAALGWPSSPAGSMGSSRLGMQRNGQATAWAGSRSRAQLAAACLMLGDHLHSPGANPVAPANASAGTFKVQGTSGAISCTTTGCTSQAPSTNGGHHDSTLHAVAWRALSGRPPTKALTRTCKA